MRDNHLIDCIDRSKGTEYPLEELANIFSIPPDLQNPYN